MLSNKFSQKLGSGSTMISTMSAILPVNSSGALYPVLAPSAGRVHPNRSRALRHLHVLAGVSFLSRRAVSQPQANSHKHVDGKLRVLFLDVNPLCYRGSQPSLRCLAKWLSLFFSQVAFCDPVIAVFDGEDGNEYRRQLLPSYKAHRRRFSRQQSKYRRGADGGVSLSELQVTNVLQKCNVPVIKVNGFEADDVIATLTDQALQRGHQVVIGSPDKDFKQLISDDVQIVMPMPNLGRWSFYTLKHYIEQYKCQPSSDLSLRCMIGDEVDGIPGIQHVAPGFGRKTALKLLKKHGSLVNLLAAAAVRTVGKHYAQDALSKHAGYLLRNFQVLSLRRDAKVHLKEEWLLGRDTCNDSVVLSCFVDVLDKCKSQTTGSDFDESLTFVQGQTKSLA